MPVVAVDTFTREMIGRLVGAMDWPATKAAAVTPSDTDELAAVTRGIYVGTTGDLEVVMADDTAEVVFKAVPAGTLLPIRVKQVLDGNTTADDIVALY